MNKHRIRTSLLFVLPSIFFVLVSGNAFAGNSCYSRAVPPLSILHDKEATIILEAGRVVSARGNVMEYDLGREKVSIVAEGPAARKFLVDVTSGLCGASVTVRLEPVRKSPFNTRFRAF